MVAKIFIIFSFISFSNCFSQSGWVQQNSVINSNLNSVYFENLQTGWCIGDAGRIIKTINGGVSWVQIYSGTDKNLNSLAATSLNNAFTVGDSGTILNTTDGGNTWINPIFPNHNYNFSSVFFVNDSVGFVGGIPHDLSNINMIYKSSNGGATWDSIQASGSYEWINRIFFVNENTGWIIKGFGALGYDFLYKTIDGGMNWSYQLNLSNLYSVFFIDSNIGWSSGYGSGPTMYRTNNGGENWIPCLFCGVGYSHSLFFINNLKGWGAGPGTIYFTSNGGINWNNQIPYNENLQYNSAYFTDSLTGWVVGDSGIILKTITGGFLTGFSNTSSEIPEKYFLSQNYPNPFNPVTNLEFGISDLGFVSLRVYNALGNEIAVIVNEWKNAGTYNYQFSTVNYQLSSGIYFYSLYVDGELIDTKRMVILK